MWSLEYVYWQCGGSIMVQFYILRNGMRCMAPETEQRCRDAATSQRTTTPDICYGSHGNTCVNFFWPVEIFTDLTRKIGNLLCKFAIYCVKFGVNFIHQKFCLCKKNDKYEVCLMIMFLRMMAMVLLLLIMMMVMMMTT